MEVVKYHFEKELKEAFAALNLKWIDEMFYVEEEDKKVLATIDQAVMEGSKIYFTLNDGKPVACLMLVKVNDSTYELAKFASAMPKAGSLCLEYALNDAKSFAKRLFIATNTKCEAAIHLYKKYGFTEYKTDNTYGFSAYRVNICFEKYL